MEPTSTETQPQPDVVVIGAGIAGLCAAAELVRVGRRVLVIEKSRGVGGRMATRRIGEAVCDHGAQFFTVRGRAFGSVVAAAEAAGVATIWCRGFERDGDGHPRWRGVRGMTDLPKRLAAVGAGHDAEGRCDIRVGTRVAAVGASPVLHDARLSGDSLRGVEIVLDATAGPAELIRGRGAILTAPVPQTLELLAGGGVAIDTDAGRRLATIDYDPCFALMIVLDRPSRVPPPGAVPFPTAGAGPVAWIADNHQKGISSVPALTVHATGRFSREHFDRPAEEVTRLLLDHVRPWIDGDPGTAVVATSLHRWKFALPTTLLPEPLVVVGDAPPIVCCGDAFAGPRVEGAASSGMAAGRWMARVLASLDGGIDAGSADDLEAP